MIYSNTNTIIGDFERYAVIELEDIEYRDMKRCNIGHKQLAYLTQTGREEDGGYTLECGFIHEDSHSMLSMMVTNEVRGLITYHRVKPKIILIVPIIDWTYKNNHHIAYCDRKGDGPDGLNIHDYIGLDMENHLKLFQAAGLDEGEAILTITDVENKFTIKGIYEWKALRDNQ